jgi:dCMP deaminase
MPSGWDNNCEIELDDGSLLTRPEVLHAESNCIAKLAKSTESGENADLYITLSPCLDCAKLILQTGIKSVYYKTVYRDDSGIQFLKKSNVSVEKL